MSKRRRTPRSRTASSRPQAPTADDPCPCGKTLADGEIATIGGASDGVRTFGSCCEPVLADPGAAADPEALMRSRYTAHVVGNDAHLRATWFEETAPDDIAAAGPEVSWLGLEIVSTTDDDLSPGADEKPAEGTVEFRARLRERGRVRVLHERSSFRRDATGWKYVDGTLLSGS